MHAFGLIFTLLSITLCHTEELDPKHRTTSNGTPDMRNRFDYTTLISNYHDPSPTTEWAPWLTPFKQPTVTVTTQVTPVPPGALDHSRAWVDSNGFLVGKNPVGDSITHPGLGRSMNPWRGGRRRRNPTFPPDDIPPPAPKLADNPMCVFLGAAIGVCNSLTSGFSTLHPTSQAGCLCYSSTVWAPNVFDGAAGQCASFAKTVDPPAFAPLVNMEGFCERVGDIKGPKTTAVSTTTFTKIVASQTNSGCAVVASSIAACMGKTSGFEQLQPSDQAKCFCYDATSSWAPDGFDSAVKTCAENVQTADAEYSSFYPGVTPLAGLCASVGNVLSTSTSSVASTITPPPPTPPPNTISATPTVSSSSSTEPDTTIDTTITLRGTKTPAVVVETNGGPIRRVKRAEVVGISFCCALVLLFLW